MRNRIKQAAAVLAAALILPLFGGFSILAAAQEKRVDVIFTHDTHSHLESFVTIENGEDVVLGGFAKMKTLIDEQTEKNPETLILDAGDFSMGTLVQTVYETQAAEMRMLGSLGFDVTTLGNHEFDYRSKGLANMLNTAASCGDSTPALVIGNVDWDTMEAQGLSEGQRLIKEAFDEYGAEDYVVLTKNGVKIAVFGIFGIDALACAPTCELVFEDPAEASRDIVEEIRNNETVDMIVCVSHSGTSEDKKKSEDERIAEAAPDIDLIISGHTHTKLEEPIVCKDTSIVSCGEYGKRLGSFSMVQKEDGRWEVRDYKLTAITEEIEDDPETTEKINGFLETVNTDYLSQFGYTQEQVLAMNDVSFCGVKDLGALHEELNLGNIIADSYVYAVEHAVDYDGIPVAASVVPAGTIRDSYAEGPVTVRDVYNSFSLGTGEDGIPGYPLISVYLTGSELKTAAEIDASVTDFMKTARLYCSRFHFSYNPHRMLLNKVTDCYLTGSNGERVEIENEKLYRVVTDLYTGQMLGTVTDMSYGLLSVVPKTADGTPITNFSDAIVYDQGSEMKAWAAIAGYMESFEDTDGDGIGNVPAFYGTLQGRKVVEDSRNFLDLIKNPNKFTAIFAAVIAVIIFILVLVILFIRNIIRRVKMRPGERK